MCDGPDIFLILLSILFPPLGVWVKRGICSADSLINIALCCLGYLPGLIHAWYIISKYPERSGYDAVDGGERGTQAHYLYISNGPAPTHGGLQGYGTLPANNTPSGQFPGQQSGVENQHSAKKVKAGSQPASNRPQPSAPASSAAAGPSSGGQQEHAPPSYADAIKGDNKVQDQS